MPFTHKKITRFPSNLFESGSTGWVGQFMGGVRAHSRDPLNELSIPNLEAATTANNFQRP